MDYRDRTYCRWHPLWRQSHEYTKHTNSSHTSNNNPDVHKYCLWLSYGFRMALPESWNGYTVTTGTLPFGFTVTLRHPLWTQANTYMDVPILVYPIAQWQTWEKNNFEGYPTAAPIGPTERGRNATYVFATAPRYNYSFATDWENVEEIVKSLKGF